MADSPTPVATPLATETPSTGTADGLDARVIVYNCDCHTYQQVIALFCQCIPGMNPSKAFELAWKIDHQGEAAWQRDAQHPTLRQVKRELAEYFARERECFDLVLAPRGTNFQRAV